MKKLKKRLAEYFLRPVWRDFLEKILLSLGVVYLILFSLETIVPELIIKAININFILLLILLDVALLIVFYQKVPRKVEWLKWDKQGVKSLALSLVGLFLITLFFSLYKISLGESLLYVVLTAIIFFALLKEFSPQKTSG
jgi:hypothetical protein